MTTLTETRKADRIKMGNRTTALLDELGVAYEVREEQNPHRIVICIDGPRGLSCTIDFEQKSIQPNVFVNAWNMGVDTDACMHVGRFPDGDVNPHHQRKCTTVIYGFDGLLIHVRAVLELALSGDLFDPEKEAQHVAENGTWQDRAARFEAWRKELKTA